ncbi:glycosyltransferase [Micromonospora schwarzwaldensis]|uniref:glycosyltransferase n=1 Tax=Micromonospora sp. DSM 45708 TaxID=3111767 RepID=UPI0031E40227
MRVVVAVESRYDRTPDGAMWTVTDPAHHYFTRYLGVFDDVRVLARVRDVPAVPAGAHRVDGPGVRVWPVPHYLGPAQYLRQRAGIGRAVENAAGPRDAVILQAPTPVGYLLAATRVRNGHPYGVQVCADPYDIFAPGAVQHPLRPALRRWATATLRRRCQGAAAVAYVTEHALQQRYPAPAATPTFHFSNVDLPPEAYRPHPAPPRAAPHRLVSLGSLEQRYKGIDTLLHAIARADHGLPDRRLHLTHIGDGRQRPHLRHLAERLGIAEQVTFAGVLPAGEAIRRRLHAADLFVMPSRTEGLPKALIEAMACGLPAVGTTVGGIPELLPPGHLVPPDDPDALAHAIATLLTDRHRLATAAVTNLARAHDYSAAALTARRHAFYHTVQDATRGRTSAGTLTR